MQKFEITNLEYDNFDVLIDDKLYTGYFSTQYVGEKKVIDKKTKNVDYLDDFEVEILSIFCSQDPEQENLITSLDAKLLIDIESEVESQGNLFYKDWKSEDIA